MSGFARAVEVFVDQLAAIAWPLVGCALLVRLGNVPAHTQAWRNIMQVTYPETDVRWRGVNAVLPARGGDLIEFYLVKKRVPGSTYPALTSTLVVDTAFEFIVALGLFSWAITTGALPGLSVLPDLPVFDWAWMIRHPAAIGAITGALVLAGFLVASRVSSRVVVFKERLIQGFAIWRTPGLYLRSVVPGQLPGWFFRLLTIYLFLRAFGIVDDRRNPCLCRSSTASRRSFPSRPRGPARSKRCECSCSPATWPSESCLHSALG